MTSSWISAQACSSSNEAAAVRIASQSCGAGAAPPPVAEGRAQPLAAGEDEFARRGRGWPEFRADIRSARAPRGRERSPGRRSPAMPELAQVGRVERVSCRVGGGHPDRHDVDGSDLTRREVAVCARPEAAERGEQRVGLSAGRRDGQLRFDLADDRRWPDAGHRRQRPRRAGARRRPAGTRALDGSGAAARAVAGPAAGPAPDPACDRTRSGCASGPGAPGCGSTCPTWWTSPSRMRAGDITSWGAGCPLTLTTGGQVSGRELTSPRLHVTARYANLHFAAVPAEVVVDGAGVIAGPAARSVRGDWPRQDAEIEVEQARGPRRPGSRSAAAGRASWSRSRRSICAASYRARSRPAANLLVSTVGQLGAGWSR